MEKIATKREKAEFKEKTCHQREKKKVTLKNISKKQKTNHIDSKKQKKKNTKKNANIYEISPYQQTHRP